MIEWLENNVPLSKKFDDTFFTKSDGRAETDHVYIKGNRLPERWQRTSSFTIGELGFGTGLNFLETARQWQLIANADAKLTFISFEKYPMTSKQISQAIATWPSLTKMCQQLCKTWDTKHPVFETAFSSRITLKVIFGDANQTLPKSQIMADAWYLDGFSPAKNPELWNDKLLQSVYNATTNGGTFATYTVAGFIRKNLLSAGFEIAKQTGFGNKREMLIGNKYTSQERSFGTVLTA